MRMPERRSVWVWLKTGRGRGLFHFVLDIAAEGFNVLAETLGGFAGGERQEDEGDGKDAQHGKALDSDGVKRRIRA